MRIMGIRIRKTLGYGFDDLVTDDPRFNIPPHRITCMEDGDDDSLTYEEAKKLTDERKMQFIDHLYSYGKNESSGIVDYWDLYDRIRENTEVKFNIYDFFKYDDEYGLKNVCVFKPIFGYNSWYRYDDMMDYVEANNGAGDCMPTVKVMRWSPLYPFQSFSDAQTGQRIKDPYSTIRMINNHLEKNLIPEPISEWESFEHGSEGRYKTWKEYQENVFPSVPESIVQFCKFYNIFKDEKTVYKMIPMLYTYWS